MRLVCPAQSDKTASMASSRNKPKKTKRKKNAAQPKKKASAAAKASESPAVVMEDLSSEVSDYDSAGAMTKMRGLISGAKPEKEGFFTRRRTLGEWLLWFGAIAALYYAYKHFTGEG